MIAASTEGFDKGACGRDGVTIRPRLARGIVQMSEWRKVRRFVHVHLRYAGLKDRRPGSRVGRGCRGIRRHRAALHVVHITSRD